MALSKTGSRTTVSDSSPAPRGTVASIRLHCEELDRIRREGYVDEVALLEEKLVVMLRPFYDPKNTPLQRNAGNLLYWLTGQLSADLRLRINVRPGQPLEAWRTQWRHITKGKVTCEHDEALLAWFTPSMMAHA